MLMKTAIYVIAVLVIGMSASGKQPADKEQKSFEGRWRSESHIKDGEKIDMEKRWTVLVVENDKISWETSSIEGNLGKTGVVPYSYQFDSSKEPKTIDLTWSGGGYKGKKQWGIYRLQGDTITICLGSIDKERPKKFESEKESGISLLTLKRVKD